MPKNFAGYGQLGGVDHTTHARGCFIVCVIRVYLDQFITTFTSLRCSNFIELAKRVGGRFSGSNYGGSALVFTSTIDNADRSDVVKCQTRCLRSFVTDTRQTMGFEVVVAFYDIHIIPYKYTQ